MFVHTHRHSVYSVLDGAGTNTQFAQRASELGQWALSVTDHGNINGALDHMKACERFGIHPLLGAEVYYRPNRRVQKQAEWQNRRWHLILIAQDLVGWHNLIRITSEAFRSGFYMSPCVDDELLDLYGEGLICTTSCVLGPLSHLIEQATDAQVDTWLKRMATRFKDRLYVEIQPHAFGRQVAMNPELVARAQRWGLPLVAGVDAHYVWDGYADTQKIMALIATNTTVAKAAEKNRERLERGDEVYELGHEGLHLMSEQEVLDGFAANHPGIPESLVREAVDNTNVIARSVKPFLLDRQLKMPQVAPSEEEAERRVMAWCREGMERIGRAGHPDYERQLEHERDIMRRKRVFSYIYLIGLVVRWARSSDPLPPTANDPQSSPKRPMRVGSSRGSGGASLICFTSRITSLDPIAYKLKFERFLNLGRKGVPDIDVDFPDDRRNEVKEYVARLCGRDCVADVVAFSRFTPRAAIRDVARILGVDLFETKKVTDLFDPVHDEDLTAMRESMPELDAYASRYPEVWRHAERLENRADPFIKGVGKHAGGVIITPGPANDFIPTIRSGEEDPTQRTAWSETPRLSIVDDFGLMKADFLSIRGMAQQDQILAKIAERTGEEIDLDQLPVCTNPYDVEDEVMEKFRAGLTLGCNQFEGAAITAFLKAAQPENVVDLAAINAIYRPGPMGSKGHVTYARRRTGQETYEIPSGLEHVLGDTFGSLCFQEQIMELFEVLVGYTAAQADDVRKEIDKLNRGKSDQGRVRLAQRKEEFVTSASKMLGEETAERLWQEILPYTGYCLSGDTVVVRGASGKHAPNPEITLQELAESWQAKSPIGKKLRSKGITLLALSSDGRVRPARAISVWSNGVRPLYKIETESGRTIRVTDNHRLLTGDGYKPCSLISPGDFLICLGSDGDTDKSSYSSHAKGKSYIGRAGGKGVPLGPENPAWVDGRSILLVRAKASVAIRSRGKCEFCGREGDGTKHCLEFSHVLSIEQLGNDYTKYHSTDNILHLCNSCHKTYDYEKGERKIRWSTGRPVYNDLVTSISFDGEDEVFDVRMDSDEHNFIANGVVSHNSFNRPHASGYTLTSYQDMWLKVHYPLDFYAVLMTLESEKAPRAIKEAGYFDVSVKEPDVNRSGVGFSVDYDQRALRYGLAAIDGVGEISAAQVVELAPYDSVEHFDMANSMKYSKCNKAHRQALLEAGALDSIGGRATWSTTEKAATESRRLQVSLKPGGTFGDDEALIAASAHSQDEFDALPADAAVVIAGRIDEVRMTKVKKGRQAGADMCFATIRFGLDVFRATLFPNVYEVHKQLLEKGRGVLLNGRKDDRDQIVAFDLMDSDEFVLLQREKEAMAA